MTVIYKNTWGETKWPPLSANRLRPKKSECSSSSLFGDQHGFRVMRKMCRESLRLIGREGEEGGALRESLDIRVIVRVRRKPSSGQLVRHLGTAIHGYLYIKPWLLKWHLPTHYVDGSVAANGKTHRHCVLRQDTSIALLPFIAAKFRSQPWSLVGWRWCT